MTSRQHMQNVLQEAGLRLGSNLEDRVAYMLYRAGHRNFEQELKVGRFRLDFAWPDHKLALEVDGWHHRSPEAAAKDARRDSWLRSEDWVVVRIDDQHGDMSMDHQVARISRLVHILGDRSGWLV